MSRLPIIGTVECAAGKRDLVLAARAAHRLRCRRDEPGTLEFEILLPNDGDARILLDEVCERADAFELHRTSASVAGFREGTAGVVATIHVERCTPLM